MSTYRSRVIMLALIAWTFTLLRMAVPALGLPATGGVSIRPGHFDRSNPATRAYFIRMVRAGGGFSDEVVVTNTAQQPVRLLVDPVDGLTGATSGTVYANRQDPKRGASLWVSLKTGTITIPARATVAIPFTVKVPAGASPGDHLAGIAFQNATNRHTPGRFSVTIVTRQVIGVLIRVRGFAMPQAKLTDVKLTTFPGAKLAAAIVTIGDAGRELCRPSLSVSVNGAVTVRQLDTLLPGAEIPYPMLLKHDVPPGAHHIVVVSTGCGKTVELSRSASVAQALHTSTYVAPRVAVRSGGTWWWLVAGVAAGAAALGGGLVALLSRRRRKPGEGPADGDRPGRGDGDPGSEEAHEG